MRVESCGLETTGRALILRLQQRYGLCADGGVQPCNAVKNLGEHWSKLHRLASAPADWPCGGL